MNHSKILLFSLLLTSCMEYDSEPQSFAPAEPVQQQEQNNADQTPYKGTVDSLGDIKDESDDISLFKSCEVANQRKYMADLFRVTNETTKLPNFGDLKSHGKVCLKELNISSRSFEEGFPGKPDLIDYFALDVHFNLKVDKPGEYTFYLTSDNGSRLSIDGVEIIDNDGKHEELLKTGKIVLSQGEHKVNVKYMQLTGEIALELNWLPPGDVAPSPLPAELVSRP